MPTSPAPAKANRYLAALNQAGVHIDSETALSVGESICELRASNVPTPSAISYTAGVLTPTLGAAAAKAAAPQMVAAADATYCTG